MAKAEQDKEVRCPYCGGTEVTKMQTWTATSDEDKDNTCTITECQCFRCEYRSFWIDK
jgi:C4-type Zn-finger protein